MGLTTVQRDCAACDNSCSVDDGTAVGRGRIAVSLIQHTGPRFMSVLRLLKWKFLLKSETAEYAAMHSNYNQNRAVQLNFMRSVLILLVV